MEGFKFVLEYYGLIGAVLLLLVKELIFVIRYRNNKIKEDLDDIKKVLDYVVAELKYLHEWHSRSDNSGVPLAYMRYNEIKGYLDDIKKGLEENRRVLDRIYSKVYNYWDRFGDK